MFQDHCYSDRTANTIIGAIVELCSLHVCVYRKKGGQGLKTSPGAAGGTVKIQPRGFAALVDSESHVY